MLLHERGSQAITQTVLHYCSDPVPNDEGILPRRQVGVLCLAEAEK